MELEISKVLWEWQTNTLGNALRIADGPCERDKGEAARIITTRAHAINKGILAKIGTELHPENTRELSRAVMRETIREAARIVNEDWVTL